MKKILLPIMIGAFMLTHPVRAEEQQQRIEEIESQIKDLRAELYELKSEQMGDDMISFTTENGFSFLETEWAISNEKNAICIYYTFMNDSEEIKYPDSPFEIEAYQNGIQLETMSGYDLSSERERNLYNNIYKKVLPGYSIDTCRLFKIGDTSDVLIRFSDFYEKEEYWQTIKLQ